MNKYKLINNQTKEEHLCDKVTIDGFDYYVSDAVCYPNDAVYSSVTNTTVRFTDPRHFSEETYKKVIATNNPNINIPKVVDKVFKLAYKHRRLYQDSFNGMNECIMNDAIHQQTGFIEGYKKSQETYPFSEEDMIEFAEWKICNLFYVTDFIPTLWKSNNKNYKESYTTKELLQLWKEQQPKIVYYEKKD